jgi:hypothetical protein
MKMIGVDQDLIDELSTKTCDEVSAEELLRRNNNWWGHWKGEKKPEYYDAVEEVVRELCRAE